jgi:hypothetical protein
MAGQPSGELKDESRAAWTDASTGARTGSRIETAAFSGMATLILPLPYFNSTICLGPVEVSLPMCKRVAMAASFLSTRNYFK